MGGKQTPEIRRARYQADREGLLARQKIRRDRQREERKAGVVVAEAGLSAKLQIMVDKLAVLTELLAYTERRDDMTPSAKVDILAGAIRLLDREDKYWRSHDFSRLSVKALAAKFN